MTTLNKAIATTNHRICFNKLSFKQNIQAPWVKCRWAAMGLTVLRLWRGTSSVVKCSMTIKTDPGIPAMTQMSCNVNTCNSSLFYTKSWQSKVPLQHLLLDSAHPASRHGAATWAKSRTVKDWHENHSDFIAVQATCMCVERHGFQWYVSRPSRISRFVLPEGFKLPGFETRWMSLGVLWFLDVFTWLI